MATRRRYTKPQKAEAVGLAAMVGVSEAERLSGIPKTTIQYWMESPDFVQLRTRAQDEFILDMWVGLQIGATEIVKGFLDPNTPLRDKAAAWKEVGERYALMTGQATARTEHVDSTDTPRVSEAIREAEVAYLRVVEKPAAVGGSDRPGPSSNGHSALRAVPLSGQTPNGYKPPKAGAEGSSNGHLPDGGDRGTVAS